MSIFDKIFEEIKDIIDSEIEKDEKLLKICRILKEKVPHYDWVGFYLVDEEKENELFLGPYVGEPTEHVRIPFGRGICGQAAERKETFVVEDVSKETNYLSCSPEVKSEIVVPIMKGGRILGELDIDSHTLSPFTEEDRIFLENICRLISGKLF